MAENLELLKTLERLLKQKKSKMFYAEKLGVSVEEVEKLLSELRGEEAETGNYIAELEDRIVKYNEEKGTLESSIVSSFEPKSAEELALLHKVDLTKYKISSYWTKQRGEKFTSSLLCTLLKPSDFSPEKFTEFLEKYTPPKIAYHLVAPPKQEGESVDVLISIADFHIDRTTAQKDNIERRKEEYIRIVKALALKAASSFHVNSFVFVIGNDFFNSDNFQGTTTNGTPQDNSASFSESYEKGFETLVESIIQLKQLADRVDVILVQGNHDRTKSFYLAHALEAFFKNDYKLSFDRENSNTKYAKLGCTFIGLHHGNTKIDDLPLLFATSPETAPLFGLSKYREILTADKHHYMAKEIKGVRIQQMPSLANPSRWEGDNNFINNIRAGLAIAYHQEKGRIAEFEERL